MSTAVVDRFRKWAAHAPAPPDEALERPHVDERVADVHVSEKYVTFRLEDGRIVSVPLSWSWRLMDATEEERQHYEIAPGGQGVHWPDVDEDLSGRGALRGTPAPRPGSRPGLREERERNQEEWTPASITRLRKHLGLTQEAFARRMGVRQATVSDWENGKQKPSPMACRLLEMLQAQSP